MQDDNLKDAATLLGSESVELSHEINGKKSVYVKCLPIRKLAEYAALIEDEPALVELFTGLSPKDVDALSTSDFVKILKKGHELNFDPFTEWLKRKVEAKKMKAKAYGIDLKSENPNGDDSVNS